MARQPIIGRRENIRKFFAVLSLVDKLPFMFYTKPHSELFSFHCDVFSCKFVKRIPRAMPYRENDVVYADFFTVYNRRRYFPAVYYEFLEFFTEQYFSAESFYFKTYILYGFRQLIAADMRSGRIYDFGRSAVLYEFAKYGFNQSSGYPRI
ncbi:unknown [Acidiphilium sp. CAG:727]|nr:unknown [Acidiphilium sp. CAG:727]